MSLGGLETAAVRATFALALVAAACLFGLMLLTFVDVVGRYVFGAPVRGAYHIVQIGMAGVIFFAMPFVTAKRAHLRLEFVDKILSRRASLLLDIFIAAICAGAFALLASQLWSWAARLAKFGETTATLSIPLGPPLFALAILAGVTAAVFVLQAVTAAVRAVQK